MAYGMLSSIGMVRESSLGTLPGARTDFIEALNESVTLVVDRFETRNLIGGIYEPDDTAGLRHFEGDIVFAGIPESINKILAGVLGVSSTAEVASGTLYRHTITPRTSDLEVRRPNHSYSIEIARNATSAHIYTGCLFSKVSLNVAPNQDLRATLSLVGISASVGSATTPTFPGSPIQPYTWDTCSISLAGAASTVIEAMTIEFDNQFEALPVLANTNEPYKVKRGGSQNIRFSGTLGFEDLTDYNRFTAQTEMAMLLSFTRAASFECVIDVPRVIYTAFPVNAGGRERLTVGFEGMARYHVGSGRAIAIRTTDNRSAYLIG